MGVELTYAGPATGGESRAVKFVGIAYVVAGVLVGALPVGLVGTCVGILGIGLDSRSDTVLMLGLVIECLGGIAGGVAAVRTRRAKYLHWAGMIGGTILMVAGIMGTLVLEFGSTGLFGGPADVTIRQLIRKLCLGAAWVGMFAFSVGICGRVWDQATAAQRGGVSMLASTSGPK